MLQKHFLWGTPEKLHCVPTPPHGVSTQCSDSLVSLFRLPRLSAATPPPQWRSSSVGWTRTRAWGKRPNLGSVCTQTTPPDGTWSTACKEASRFEALFNLVLIESLICLTGCNLFLQPQFRYVWPSELWIFKEVSHACDCIRSKTCVSEWVCLSQSRGEL